MMPQLNVRQEKLEDVYEVLEELGRGQFAVVKKCISKETKENVAAKFVKVKKTKSSRNGLSREMIEREASILSLLDHDKILKLHDVFDLKIEMCLVLELLSGGELFDKISEQEYLTESEGGCYMKQVLEGIAYLHDKSIVHLDIKPENIVLKGKSGTDIKLVDFGLAQIVKPNEELREMMGTPEFVAPEVVNYDRIGLYTDMWAIGVLAYILLSGCSPFLGDDNQETYANICAVDYHFDEEYFDNISDEAKDFVKELLLKNPSKRNTAKKCIDHPWIQSLSELTSRKDSTMIQTDRFKSFQIRRKWQQSFQKMKAITRFSKFLKMKAMPTTTEQMHDLHTSTNGSSDLQLIDHSPVPTESVFPELNSSHYSKTIFVTPEDVEKTRKYLQSLSEKKKNRRKIKQYVSVDTCSDETGSYTSEECFSGSYYSDEDRSYCESEREGEESCASNENLTSEEYLTSRKNSTFCKRLTSKNVSTDISEDESDVIIKDHADGQLNRGTLEIWTQKKSIFTNRREKIRKIKRYRKGKKILYNSSFLVEMGISMKDGKKNSPNNSSSDQQIEQTLNTEIQQKLKETNKFCEESQIFQNGITNGTEIKTSTPVKVHVTDHSDDSSATSLASNCEIVEIVDKFEKMKIETIQESGPVETEIIDRVDITSIYEDIDLDEYGIDKGDTNNKNGNDKDTSRTSSVSSFFNGEFFITRSMSNASRKASNSEKSSRRSRNSSECDHILMVNNNNDVFESTAATKWETNSEIAEEFSRRDSFTSLTVPFTHTQSQKPKLENFKYTFLDDYVIIDLEQNTTIKCRDRHSSSLLVFVK